MNVEIGQHVLRRVIEALSDQLNGDELSEKIVTVIRHGGEHSDLMQLVRAYNGAIACRRFQEALDCGDDE